MSAPTTAELKWKFTILTVRGAGRPSEKYSDFFGNCNLLSPRRLRSIAILFLEWTKFESGKFERTRNFGRVPSPPYIHRTRKKWLVLLTAHRSQFLLRSLVGIALEYAKTAPD